MTRREATLRKYRDASLDWPKHPDAPGSITFPPEHETPGPIRPDFIVPLIDADVVILEENENAVGFETHVGAFYDLTFGG